LREIAWFGTRCGRSGCRGGLLFEGGDAVTKRAGLWLGRRGRIRHVGVVVMLLAMSSSSQIIVVSDCA
jgi:hypothetical protein